jgi:hypothetical protein
MSSDIAEIKVSYALNSEKSPVVVMSFNHIADGAVLSPTEARSLAKHLYDAAFNAELSARKAKPVTH